MTIPADRQVLTVDDLTLLSGMPGQTIRGRVRKHGTIFGVAPIPDTGARLLFSRALIERALSGERVSA